MQLGSFEIVKPPSELKDPHVLAVLRPWIDVGSVGSLSLNRIERHLRAVEMGRLARPGRFYDFTRYRPRTYLNQGLRELSIPNTIIRYSIREESPDFIILHLLEPHLHGEDFTDSLLEVLKFFGVKRYSLMGGMYDMVPHTRPLLVSGSANQSRAEEENGSLHLRPSTYEGPTAITSLLSIQAAELGIETQAYVVHLPQYYQVEEDFTGTARLMEIVCALYNLPQRLIEQERGRQQYKELQSMVDEASGVPSFLQRLEESYDRDRREEEPTPPLSPNIEQFLRELDDDLAPPA